ncbi:uncharacterized protein LOC141628573 [Silene latifolia]|uniref:uncharacterized protein LOC141628573 n=1 Tax=Silene latifolia TaxID=37657 RepID=UPI003D76DAA1
MGSEFTWSNKQGSEIRTWARLDRVLVKPAWLTIFPASYALSMPPGPSDHYPLMVSLAPASPIKRRFSFLNAWKDHPNYQGLIQTAWNTPCYGTPIGQLEDCQKELQADLFSPLLIEKEKHLSNQYVKLCMTEVDILFQKAKVNNINKGDCSKHAIRRHQSTIGMINDKDGITGYGIANVNEAFVDYYTSLLGRKINVAPISDIVFSSGPGVSDEAGVKLIAPVTREEIRRALFSISPNKSPGRMGFLLVFSRKTGIL